MVKVYNDILIHLSIEHTFLTGVKNSFCKPVEISDLIWVVFVDDEISENDLTLHIKYKGSYIETSVIVIKKESKNYTLQLTGKNKTKKMSLLLAEVKKLENDHITWEKRKEKRYEIGIVKSKVFNLSKPEQKAIIHKRELPCLINNLSFSGANITTYGFPEIRKGMDICITIKFLKPIEQVNLYGYIQHIELKSAKSNNGFSFAILAIEFRESPLSYKKRFDTFINEAESSVGASTYI